MSANYYGELVRASKHAFPSFFRGCDLSNSEPWLVVVRHIPPHYAQLEAPSATYRGPKVARRWERLIVDALLELAFQFEDSCAVRDDLRKSYEKCNDMSQESRALICTFLKESSGNDHKLHLSMYGKASRLEKHMGAKLAWLREKYSHRTREEALRETLEKEVMNKKAQEEIIR
ncbi:hypothetical protein Tco_0116079 [Tanacetum coccineum]